MNTENKDLIKYAAITAGLLVSGGLAFHLLKNYSGVNRKCFKEIDQLGPVQKDINGMLNFNYYKEVFMIISKYAKESFWDEKKKLLEHRRKCLREGNLVEYREIVRDMISKEEKTFDNLLKEAMTHIGMNETEFKQMH